MNKKEIAFRDPVVERVVEKFVERSDIGFKKYKSTLHDERTSGKKDLLGYLNDVQEELMDAILYIQAAREELTELGQEEIIRRSNPCSNHAFEEDDERVDIIDQNRNDGLHYDESHDGYMLDNDEIWGNG
jgi:hypothetical protein